MSKRNHNAELTDQFILESESDQSRTTVSEAIRVGRDPSCDLTLSSGKCSRVHAKLFVEDDALWVEDQGSTNGTLVNRNKIKKRTRLENGDIVQFGDVRFRVIAPEPEASELDDQGTIMIGEQTMLHVAGDGVKAEEPGGDREKPEKPAATPKAESPKPKPQPRAKAGKNETESAGSGKAKSASKAAKPKSAADKAQKPEKPKAKRPEPEKPEAPSIESRAGDNPSIPRSWADADQLEQASHTAFVARPPVSASDSQSGALHPLKAIAEARRSIPAEEAILVGLTEPIQGKPFKLNCKGGTEKWEMGRGKGADIDIDDESVSGRHAQLICEGGRWKVVNMMSVNGTFVNERKVLSAYLGPRDVIRMGSVELVFDARVEKRGPSRQARRSASGERPAGGSFLAKLARQARDLWSKITGRPRGGQ